MRGEDNTIADALSRIKAPMMDVMVAPVFTITADTQLLDEIRTGYEKDEWCRKLRENLQSSTEASKNEGLLYWKKRLVIQ